jgi:hypothetical protein
MYMFFNSDGVKKLYQDEYISAQKVKRTFTEIGFAKGKLPVDLFSSITTFYYNNKDHLALVSLCFFLAFLMYINTCTCTCILKC